MASVGLAARSSIFMENRGPWGTLRRACISEPRDATTLVREFRPLGFAASDRRDQSAATRGALCTCVKLTRSSSLPLSLSLSLFYLSPCTPAFSALLRSFLSLRPRDPTRRWLRISSPPSSFSLCLRHASSLSFASLSPRTPSLSAVHFLPRTERISSVLSRRVGFYRCRCRRCFSLARSATLRSLDSVAEDRGLRGAVTCTPCFFLRQQREGVRSITFDRPVFDDSPPVFAHQSDE